MGLLRMFAEKFHSAGGMPADSHVENARIPARAGEVEQAAAGADFVSALISANRLEKTLGRGYLLFFPGMCFASPQKWWGKGGRRDQPHEGLDLCFFADAGGNRFRLDESVRIPAAFDGEVAGMIRDFMGSTVIVAHRPATDCPTLYILYAHLRPDTDLQVGRQLAAGQTFAAIAPAGHNRALPPHLHLSLIPAGCMPPAESLSWPMLNRLDRSRFLDPLRIIDRDWEMMDYEPGMNLNKAFVPSGRCHPCASGDFRD